MRLTIDGKPTQVEAGTTILQAAGRLGIEIPTLCHLEGIAPQTSCFVCVVRVEGNDDFIPSCTAMAGEGMAVTTDSPEIRATRKMALELLLSDHAGNCIASCAMACPADLDIPGFSAPLAEGRVRAAIAVIKQSIPFPAVLGRICPAFCENACQRKRIDESLSIRSLHALAAQVDLASGDPYIPACRPSSDERVAIVGAGPAGLSAAYYLLQEGHSCELLEAGERAGGLLREALAGENAAQAVAELDEEIAVIERLGAKFTFHWRLGSDGTLDSLRAQYDAVLLALGAWVDAPRDTRKVDLDLAQSQGLRITKKGIDVDRRTLATSVAGVFAAGEAASGPGHAVHAVAAGRRAAASIHQYLSGALVAGEGKPFYFQSRQQTPEELDLLYGEVEKTPCALCSLHDANPANAASEAERCLQCGCDKAEDCRLRGLAARYHVQAGRFRGERRTLQTDDSHSEITYDPGKCILCGLCLKIAEQAGEPLGLSFVGRGFATRMTPALGATLAEGLQTSARACAQACPSGALSFK